MKKVPAVVQRKVYQPKERYGSSGYGAHGDRRTKRNRSRNDQRSRWMREWQ